MMVFIRKASALSQATKSRLMFKTFDGLLVLHIKPMQSSHSLAVSIMAYEADLFIDASDYANIIKHIYT